MNGYDPEVYCEVGELLDTLAAHALDATSPERAAAMRRLSELTNPAAADAMSDWLRSASYEPTGPHFTWRRTQPSPVHH